MLLTMLRKTLFLSNYLQIFDFSSCSNCLGLCDSCYTPEYTCKGSVNSQSESPSYFTVTSW